MENATEDVNRLTGNPRQAIRRMSIPLTVALFVSYLQNFVDTIWCSGLGSSALSAVTVSGPVYWIIADVGIGLGVGAATSIARSIGAERKDRADSLSSQAILLSVIASVILTVILIFVCDPTLRFMNDGGDIGYCRDYVYPYYIFILPMVLNGVVLGILRAEGAGGKVLRLSAFSAVINLVIDPVLIYTLDMGLAGAAVATGLSFTVSTLLGLRWLLGGRMFVRPTFRGFRFKADEMRDILIVGIPHMFEMVAICILMIPQNMLVMRTGGEEGVMLAMTPYKYIMLTTMPAEGLAEAMIPVTSATQGAGDMAKTRDGFLYTVRLAALISLGLSVMLIIFADPLMYLFTYSDNMSQYHSELTDIMRLYGIITLFAGLTYVFSSVLQSLRMAVLATITTFVRESVFVAMYWVASSISMDAIYYSMVLGMLFGVVLMGIFAGYGIRKIPRKTMSQTAD